jgi:hypothetical protein
MPWDEQRSRLFEADRQPVDQAAIDTAMDEVGDF